MQIAARLLLLHVYICSVMQVRITVAFDPTCRSVDGIVFHLTVPIRINNSSTQSILIYLFYFCPILVAALRMRIFLSTPGLDTFCSGLFKLIANVDGGF